VRILVTGSKGFVGHWLLRHLDECGDEVVAIDAEVEITDESAVTEAMTAAAPDAVCHLAAQASVGTSWAAPGPTYQVNTIGVVNVVTAALACAKRPRVVLISSSEVYGRVADADLPLREDQPFAAVSPYAASKAAAEMVALQAWLGSGLEVIRARPFNHTGPGQRPDFVVPALAKQVAEAAQSGADALYTGNLEAKRDITDVRDVVRAYRLLLEKGRPGEAYNVCRGDSVSIRSIAERLLVLAGADLPIVVDPDRVRPVEIADLRGDPSRLRAATGWEAEIPLDVTLRDCLENWKRPAA
jgi:GDP-4-dehydro-6-deoxy-D-mannose reductase